MDENQTIAGRFAVQHAIGQGGMGDVYQGLDTETGQTVAIKHLKPDILAHQPDLIARFEREGEILRQLDHPNIVKILATVREDDDYYLVMDYVGGGSLRELMDEYGQLPIPRALDIALDLADALTRAHRLRVIHRDIKPANILIADDGTPRLTDFGVAHMDERSRVTATGSVIGTFAYLSPEACAGEDATHHADIWSFGVVLYEMLAGRRPFDAPNPMALLQAITTQPTPDIREFRPDVPPPLVNLINCMLQKDRTDRLPSVRLAGAGLEAVIYGVDFPTHTSELAQHVGAVVPGSRFATPTPPNQIEAGEGAPTVLITPTPPPQMVEMPVHKFYKMAGMVMLACVLAVTALVIALVTSHDDPQPAASPPPDSAAHEGPGEPGSTHELFGVPAAEGETLIVVTDFESAGGSDRRPELAMIEVLDTFAAEFDDVRVVHHPQPVTTTAAVTDLSARYHASVVIFGLDMPGGVTANYYITPLTERLPNSLAEYLYLDISNRLRQNTDAIEDFDTFVYEGMDSAYVTALATGTYYAFAGRFLDAQRALAWAEARFDETQPAPEQAFLLFLMQGYTYLELGQDDTSCAYFGRALDYKPDDPDALMLRADCLDDENPATALASAQQVLNVLNEQLGQYPNDSKAYFRRGYTYMGLGREYQALADFGEAIRLDPSNAFAHVFRGVIYYDRAEFDSALADFEEAIRLNPAYPLSYAFRGMIYTVQGEYERALADLDFYLAHVGSDEDVLAYRVKIEEALAGTTN